MVMDLDRDFTELVDQARQSTAFDTYYQNNKTSQVDSRLLQLPVEVRQIIWRYLLVAETSIFPRGGAWANNYRNLTRSQGFEHIPFSLGQEMETFMAKGRKYGLSPQLIGTCQTILQEAGPLLYSENTLCLIIVAPADPPRDRPNCRLRIHVGEEHGELHEGFDDVDQRIFRTFSRFLKIELKLLMFSVFQPWTSFANFVHKYGSLLDDGSASKSIRATFHCYRINRYSLTLRDRRLPIYAAVLQSLRFRKFTYNEDQKSMWKPLADIVTSRIPRSIFLMPY